MVSRLTFITLSAVVYNYNNNINIIIMSINTFFKVRDGRIRVYKKYVYKYVPFFSGLRVVEGRTQLLYLSARLFLLSQSLSEAFFPFPANCHSISFLSLSRAFFLALSYSPVIQVTFIFSSDSTCALCSAFVTPHAYMYITVIYNNYNYNQYTQYSR